MCWCTIVHHHSSPPLNTTCADFAFVGNTWCTCCKCKSPQRHYAQLQCDRCTSQLCGLCVHTAINACTHSPSSHWCETNDIFMAQGEDPRSSQYPHCAHTFHTNTHQHASNIYLSVCTCTAYIMFLKFARRHDRLVAGDWCNTRRKTHRFAMCVFN